MHYPVWWAPRPSTSHAHQLNLALSDKTLADLIRTDPAFQGPTGTFSTQAFQSVLRQVGLSEARFVADRRKEEIRDQLTETLLAGELCRNTRSRCCMATARKPV